jgi:hypothetical protein
MLAYILAVVDGTLQDKGTYPSDGGRTGIRLYCRTHPCIVAGALCGVAGTVVGFL